MLYILSNLLRTSIGFLLIGLSIFLFFAIIDFSLTDTTLLNATNTSITNITGKYGANIADISLQSFGYAIFLPIIFILILGIKSLQGKSNRLILLRITILLFTVLTFSALLTFLNKSTGNEVNSYGGFIGSYIKSELTASMNSNLVLLILTILLFVGIIFSLGLTFKQWKKIFKYTYITVVKLTYKISKIIRLIYIKIYNILTKLQGDDNSSTTSIFETNIRIKDGPKLIDDDEVNSRQVDSDVVEETENSNQIVQATSKNILSYNHQTKIFILPPTSILNPIPVSKKNQINSSILDENANALWQVLQDFGVNGNIVNVYPGPVVTLYELEPAAGTKSSRVIGLADDIARSMSSTSARIAVVPGRNAIGIELPNTQREIVYLRELLESNVYRDHTSYLPLVLGKNIGGESIIVDLAKMPHLLVAGTTGSGKSVAINTMILSLLYNHSPKTCRLVMIDPKMLELSVYEGIPHLLAPVVIDPKKAISALKWVVKEMEERYRAMSTLGVRNIHGYNTMLQDALTRGKHLTRQVQTGFDQGTGKPIFETITMSDEILPYIVVIVDEMADLMLVAGKDIEASIQRLAQMARAAGIHLIMATQRPSVDVITGVIKANFPTRISFQVTSKIDSRTILGEQGAEQLLGMGDMLYMMPGGKIERVHGPFVDDKEVEKVVAFIKQQGPANYIEDITAEDEDFSESILSESNNGSELYDQAVSIVIQDRKASTSYIQRSLKIGYNRAATLIERMEKEGVISAPNHVGKREILVNSR